MYETDLSIITRLPIERWSEFRELRLLALQLDPAAFGQTHAAATDCPDDFWQSKLQEVHDETAWITFAELNGQLVGMIGAFSRESDTDQRGAKIWGAFVDPSVRGQGAASRMLGALLAELAGSHFESVILAVNSEQDAAVRLYERHGFRIVGQDTAILGDGLPHVGFLMELSSGSRAG